MQVSIEIQTSALATWKGSNVSSLRGKRYTSFPVLARFTDDGVVKDLGADAWGMLAVKIDGEEDYLATAHPWIKVGSGPTTYYIFSLNLNTDEINDLFEVAAPSYKIAAKMEIRFVYGGFDERTVTASFEIENSQISGDVPPAVSGQPAWPSPTELADAMAEAEAALAGLDTKVPLTQKGANSGIASLGETGKVPVAQLPDSSEAARGIVRLASIAESEAGLDSEKSVHPAGLFAGILSKLASWWPTIKSSAQAISGAWSFTGNVTVGDSGLDTLSVNATQTNSAPVTMTGQPSSPEANTAMTRSLTQAWIRDNTMSRVRDLAPTAVTTATNGPGVTAAVTYQVDGRSGANMSTSADATSYVRMAFNRQGNIIAGVNGFYFGRTFELYSAVNLMVAANVTSVFAIGVGATDVGVPGTSTAIGIECNSSGEVRLWRSNGAGATYGSWVALPLSYAAATAFHFWLMVLGNGTIELRCACNTFNQAFPARPSSALTTLTGAATGNSGGPAVIWSHVASGTPSAFSTTQVFALKYSEL